MFKRAITILLSFVLILGMLPTAMAAEDTSEKLSVVYIPLDNRPFNNERVQTMAESLNIALIMPDEDLYSTRLDGQNTNANGTQYGNREALFSWLQEQADQYDIFILSLDQLLSGGLMNSRCMTENLCLQFEDGTLTEYDVIDYIAELSQDNQVYIIDSVLRLATSCDYGGYNLDHYNIFSAYGKVARPTLSGSSLTVENIVQNYRYCSDGTTSAYLRAGLTESQLRILLSPLDENQEDSADSAAVQAYLHREEPAETVAGFREAVSAEPRYDEAQNSVLSRYLSIRERKLRLSDYAMQTLCRKKNIHYLLGVDDSSMDNNIQSNEISLLSVYLRGDRDQIFSSLDGLGQAALAKIFLSEYGSSQPSIGVTYLGSKADEVLSYNCYTPREMMTQTIAYFGGTTGTQDPDISVIVLTDPASEEDRIADMCRLVDLLNQNEALQIPTILIDLLPSSDTELGDMLLEHCHLGMLLSYSGQPEMPNSIIMAMSQGLARYRSLQIEGFQTEETQAAHLKNLAAALIKKFAFSDGAFYTMYSVLESYGLYPRNFQSVDDSLLDTIHQRLTTEVQTAAEPLLKNLRESNFIASLTPYTLRSITGVQVSNCRYPWLRHMEIDCTVDVQTNTTPYAVDTAALNPSAGWHYIDGGWYYFQSRGSRKIGWHQEGGNTYYLDGRCCGKMIRGWFSLNDVWYYFNSSGIMQTGWLKLSEKWYYFDGSGQMQTGWLQQDGSWYYLRTDGSMYTGWLQLGGNWFYLNASGKMATEWYTVNNKRYYFNASGIMQTGWLKLDGTWYYLDPTGGQMVTGWADIGSHRYYFDESGIMQTGWLQLDGRWYYLRPSGKMITGWADIGSKRYYFEDSGRMKTGWLQQDGVWYYLKSSGQMVTGWADIGSHRYYFDESGIMQTGWLRTGDGTYYLKSGGQMAVGWCQVDGSWYYFSTEGPMQTGWLKLSGSWYYLDPEQDGRMAIGWYTVDGDRYYFRTSGAMKTGWLKLDNTWYYLKSGGQMVTGWYTVGGSRYYFQEDGAMVTGTCIIDGIEYQFDENGALIS